ncbi:MAG: helix-hairpin-helix domain-containing protein [Candidatus Azobacteroides sp.]|nr:helix-hairpin-helix domain-containing protein [Candidatus Azobacteroides sp.]
MWKQFLYFSKAERVITLVLVTLVFILLIVTRCLPYLISPVSTSIKEEDLNTYLSFLESLEKKENIPFSSDISSERFVFNPNKADSATLVRLGLKPYQAGNIVKYRTKGGVFRTKKDITKIYGIEEEWFQEIQPYIDLPEKQAYKSSKVVYEKPKHTFTPSFPRQEKYSQGTIIDLNLADTTELKKIPGIGSGIAKRIVQYRSKLGGFYSVKQLKEVWGISPETYETLIPWFTIKSPSINRLKVNFLDLEQLRQHPYINYYQAKAFVTLRNNKGKLESIDQFSLLDEFSEHDRERLHYYLDFQ